MPLRLESHYRQWLVVCGFVTSAVQRLCLLETCGFPKGNDSVTKVYGTNHMDGSAIGCDNASGVNEFNMHTHSPT